MFLEHREHGRALSAFQETPDGPRRVVLLPKSLVNTNRMGTRELTPEARATAAFAIADGVAAERRYCDVGIEGFDELIHDSAAHLVRLGFAEADEETAEGVAQCLLALSQIPPRDLTYDVLRRFFDATLTGRSDISVVETAVLDALAATGHVELFSQKAERLIFGESPQNQLDDLPKIAFEVKRRKSDFKRFGVDNRSQEFIDACRFLLMEDSKISTTVAGTGPGGPGRDAAQAAANFKRAVDYVVSRAQDPAPLRTDDIVEINRILLDDVEAQGRAAGVDAGAFRDFQLYAGDLSGPEIRQYPEADQVAPLMERFGQWFDETSDRVDRGEVSAEAFAPNVYRRLVSIHPYADANGRSTRLASALILMKNGIPPPLLVADREKMPSVYASAAVPLTESEYATHYADAIRRGNQVATIMSGRDPITAFREADAEVQYLRGPMSQQNSILASYRSGKRDRTS